MPQLPDSDDDGYDGHHPSAYVDLEASEAAPESDEDVIPEHSFPQFGGLPPELRHQVWEHFCPPLTAKNVWEFRLLRRPEGTGSWYTGESASLSQHTEPVRRMLSIHRETRDMALSAFPDTLSLARGAGVVRFNSDRDVVLVSGEHSSTREFQHTMSITGFCENIKHLAVEKSLRGLFRLDEWLHPISLPLHFPKLKCVYICIDDDECAAQHLRWCASDNVNQFYLRTEQIEPGLGEDADFIYSWPDLAKHADFARQEIPFEEFHSERLPITIFRDNLRDYDNVEVWPMVRFSFESGVAHFEELATGTLADNSDNEDDDEDSETDEYESEGINDGEIEENEWTDEEDDLAVLSDGADEEGSSFGGFSPPQLIDLTGEDARDAPEEARFSSPEPVSNSAHESDDSASDDGPVAASRRSKKRRIIASSDAEEDSDVEPVPKRARLSERRAPIVLSDSDDGEEEGGETDGGTGGGVNRRRTTVVIDDESDEEEGSEEGEEVDEEEDDDDEDDEERRPTKPLSLVERLRLGREQNPIPDDSDSEEDDSDLDGNNIQGRRRSRVHERHAYDDEDEEEDEDEDEDESGFIDGMAEESDGEGSQEEEDEDGW